MTYPALRINIYCKNTKKNANRTYFAATVFNLKKNSTTDEKHFGHRYRS